MKYTVDEFEGDTPLEKNARDFDNLRDAKSFAREWYAKQPNPALKGDLKGGYHIDVFRMDTGFCFLTLGGPNRSPEWFSQPGRRQK